MNITDSKNITIIPILNIQSRELFCLNIFSILEYIGKDRTIARIAINTLKELIVIIFAYCV
jgi:hypothetical protein